MRVDAWDTVFVRGRRRDLHPIVADVTGWGRWWPGVTTQPVAGGVAVTARPPAPGRLRRARVQRFSASVTRERPDLGVDLSYDGDVRGEAEFFYLDEPAGTLVHYLLRGEVADRGWRRRLSDHRAVARVGLEALKARLEGSRAPGAEPDPVLLADQRRALAEYRARAAAGRRAARTGR